MKDYGLNFLMIEAMRDDEIDDVEMRRLVVALGVWR